jgi:hypothetical protein
MTDLEISKALALAIGYLECDIWVCVSRRQVLVQTNDFRNRTKVGSSWCLGWRPFDYRRWGVAGPIATKYACFPEAYIDGWFSWVGLNPAIIADTPQKAIALAVIGAKK